MPMTRRSFLQSSLGALAAAAAGGSGAAEPQPKKQRILILGGTAFLGPALVEAARSRGHAVTLFNRGKTRPELFPDVEKLRGDRDGKLDALRGRSWDAVVDTSGYVPRIVKMSAELLAPKVGRYLFVSSISVYPEDVKAGADESTAVQELEDPTTEDVRKSYGALKAACERAAEAAMPGRVAIVRPGLIVGPEDPTDRFTYWPVRLDRGGDVLSPGDGSDPVQVIDVRDLAAWMIALAERGARGTFNATGPAGRLPMREMLERSRDAIRSKASLVWVPASFLAERHVSPWSDLPAWIPAGKSGFASLSNARAVAGGLRFRPVGETAKDTLAWWKAQPPERRAKPRAGLSEAREREVLAAWKAR
ncbi:MAG TPA: NAD-dependent epimerase/dehydratase family protein [Anaeromyxobacter sp.]